MVLTCETAVVGVDKAELLAAASHDGDRFAGCVMSVNAKGKQTESGSEEVFILFFFLPDMFFTLRFLTFF